MKPSMTDAIASFRAGEDGAFRKSILTHDRLIAFKFDDHQAFAVRKSTRADFGDGRGEGGVFKRGTAEA